VSEQTAIRNRLSQSFRYIVSQRLLPRKDGQGRVAAIEILKSTMRTRDYVQNGERDGQSLHDAMHDGELEGMQHFDGVLEKMVRDSVISKATALGYATNAGNLNLSLSDYDETEA
jgi:twitching motility protein PilT